MGRLCEKMLHNDLREMEKNNHPICLSFYPSSALLLWLHTPVCARRRALKINKNPAQLEQLFISISLKRNVGDYYEEALMDCEPSFFYCDCYWRSGCYFFNIKRKGQCYRYWYFFQRKYF